LFVNEIVIDTILFARSRRSRRGRDAQPQGERRFAQQLADDRRLSSAGRPGNDDQLALVGFGSRQRCLFHATGLVTESSHYSTFWIISRTRSIAVLISMTCTAISASLAF